MIASAPTYVPAYGKPAASTHSASGVSAASRRVAFSLDNPSYVERSRARFWLIGSTPFHFTQHDLGADVARHFHAGIGVTLLHRCDQRRAVAGLGAFFFESEQVVAGVSDGRR